MQAIRSLRLSFGKNELTLSEGFKIVHAEYISFGYPRPVRIHFLIDPEKEEKDVDLLILDPDESAEKLPDNIEHLISFSTTPQKYSHVFIRKP